MTSGWMSDVRLAFRYLAKRLAFTCVAAGTLALGIGAATALFSVVYGVLISPYPYADPDEIWAFGVSAPAGPQRMRPFRYDAFEEMARLPALADVMATAPGSRLLTGTFAPETVTAIEVSGNAFGFLGVRPVLGRAIQPSDVLPDGAALASRVEDAAAVSPSQVLMVQGFDRISRQQNPTMTTDLSYAPPAGAVDTFERVRPRASNSYDYIARVGEAIGAAEVWVCDDAVTSHAGALSLRWGVSLTAGTGVACLVEQVCKFRSGRLHGSARGGTLH